MPMFIKLEQSSWIKIEVARRSSTQECIQGLCEACGDAVLPYRTVARWVKAFQEGSDAVQDSRTWRTTHLNSLLPSWMLIAGGLRGS